MIKKHHFKLLPGRDTSALMIITMLVIIGAANLNKQFKNGGSISKTFEQKELSTMNQQEELIYQESAEGTQSHVHEFEGSVMFAEEGDDRHNHRFAGVTSQVIPDPGGHRHAILTNTDFFENHHHEIGVITGLPIPVGNGKHVHFVGSPLGNTTLDDGHFHQFQFTTLIDSPLT
jgi:hypothetical protein